jgi:hypothetical protein
MNKTNNLLIFITTNLIQKSNSKLNNNMTDLTEIKNNFESKCDIKIETNSRGQNTTIHVYEGVTFQ